MTKKHYNYITICILTLICFTTSLLRAQQITGQLKAIGKQYQRITIPQEYSRIIGSEWGQIRIKDSKGVDVPYRLYNPPLDEKQFVHTPFVTTQTDSSQTFVVQNIPNKRINNLLLKIANTNAQKEYTIEGSKDQNTWFVLDSKGYLQNLQSSNDTYVITPVNFPLNDYAYIRLQIQNKKSAPINLLDIGQIEVNNMVQEYDELKNVSITIKENKKEKQTLLSIQKDGRTTFDYIKFHVKNPESFTRSAMIYGQEEILYKKNIRTINTGEFYFDLNNVNASHIEIPSNEYPASFFVNILNEDNPPLQIEGLTLYHKPVQIVAFLDENLTYTLEADSNWNTPNYDLDKLNLDLTKIKQSASLQNVQLIEVKSNDNVDNKHGNLILIISCIAGALIVFYFGFSLIKDMKKG